MDYKTIATEIVLGSMNNVKESPEPVKIGDRLITVIGGRGTGKTTLLKNRLIVTSGHIVETRVQNVENKHLQELSNMIETDLDIRASRRVKDVVESLYEILKTTLGDVQTDDDP